MSTYYSYHCNTCDEDSDADINHGDALLRRLWRLRFALRQFQALDTAGDCMIESQQGAHEFVMEHAEHDVEIWEEYGRHYAVEDGRLLARTEDDMRRNWPVSDLPPL